MAGIKSRGEKPVPGIEYSEILITNENNVGTGIKLMVNINLATESVTALLGKADKSPPASRESFKLPKKFKVADVHTFDVVFRDWSIKELKMNGKKLPRSSETK
jgi:hypothetical protein